MDKETNHRRSIRMTALKIVALYAAFSSIWLAGFDWLLDAIDLRHFETDSDILLVFISSIVFFVLLVRFIGKHDETQRILREKSILADRAWLMQKHNQELRAINAKLLASNSELEQFAYVASHDLREPLRHVSSYVGLLEESCPNLDEESREYIHFARQGARRMDALITDLLEYCRINRGRNQLEMVDLNQVLAEVIDMSQVTIGQCAATVTADPDLPTVKGDRLQLLRLFQNLVGNALKYRDTARAPVIRIASTHDGQFWRVSVIDNGIGIAADQHQRVFGIFQRLHSRDEYEGTGIGLAICRKIAIHHGGTIELASIPGQGSVFTVLLPQSPVPDTPEQG